MNTSSSVSFEKITETELLSFLTHFAIDKGYPVAFWRLPDSGSKKLIISQNHQSLSKDSTIEDLNAGFIFAPFDQVKERLFIPADFIFTFSDGILQSPQTPAENTSESWLADKLQNYSYDGFVRIPKRASLDITSSGKDRYISLVERGIHEIERGTLEKIVPSRTKLIDLPGKFDLIETFQKLCTAYPHAYVSFVSIPGVGSWLGATPETLVSVEGQQIFKTVALAGTKPFTPGTNLKSVAWTQKEIEEQALVERYVISCFKKIRLREYDEHGPKTVVAGNLMHLRSDFTVDMKATNFLQLGSVMLNLLHPTSAVCGMPLQASQDFLKKYEGYDREFYAGYLGPVNIDNNTHIFVNLRCMQLTGDQGILYSGAGVTSDSIAEQEWEETEMKFNTLLNIIF